MVDPPRADWPSGDGTTCGWLARAEDRDGDRLAEENRGGDPGVLIQSARVFVDQQGLGQGTHAGRLVARLATALERQLTIYAEYGSISSGAIEDMRADRDASAQRLKGVSTLSVGDGALVDETHKHHVCRHFEGSPWCDECGEPYPCLTIRLATALERVNRNWQEAEHDAQRMAETADEHRIDAAAQRERAERAIKVIQHYYYGHQKMHARCCDSYGDDNVAAYMRSELAALAAPQEPRRG